MREPRIASLWLGELPDAEMRPALSGRHHADVAIVGGGYSGLWTAYYLAGRRPDLRISVLDAQWVGFGASGRNGGWCSSHFGGVDAMMARPGEREAGIALQRAVFDAVDEVGRVSRTEGIDCGFHKGGMLHFAANPGELERLRARAEALDAYGFGPDDHTWLDATTCKRRLTTAKCLGGLLERHTAAVHPLRLARGLAAAAEQRGVTIFENSHVEEIGPGRLRGAHGVVHAAITIRATEGYTPLLPGSARDVIPIHSWMVATEPLTPATWDEIGLADREVFGDGRRMVTYGQRTEDGRIAFGSRGTYRFGSRIEERSGPEDPHFAPVRARLVEMLPVLQNVRLTHAWGGPLAATRDGRPFVCFHRESGFGALGGYTGSGVAAANLTGRTLADLVAGVDSERTRLPFVRPLPRRWEIEPLRWLGVTTVLRAGESADAAERRGARPRGRDWMFQTMAHG